MKTIFFPAVSALALASLGACAEEPAIDEGAEPDEVSVDLPEVPVEPAEVDPVPLEEEADPVVVSDFEVGDDES